MSVLNQAFQDDECRDTAVFYSTFEVANGVGSLSRRVDPFNLLLHIVGKVRQPFEVWSSANDHERVRGECSPH
jgi:hypothetical protein